MSCSVSDFGGFFNRGRLRVQVLERSRFDSARPDEGVDLGLFETNDPPESICGKLPFVDEAVQRARCQPKCRRCFLGGQPVTICIRHDKKPNTISAPLSRSRRSTYPPAGTPMIGVLR